jgi:hypothetical protein
VAKGAEERKRNYGRLTEEAGKIVAIAGLLAAAGTGDVVVGGEDSMVGWKVMLHQEAEKKKTSLGRVCGYPSSWALRALGLQKSRLSRFHSEEDDSQMTWKSMVSHLHDPRP